MGWAEVVVVEVAGGEDTRGVVGVKGRPLLWMGAPTWWTGSLN